jgi:hypothetical protein
MLPPFERITAEEAATRLRRSPGTIHCWGTRYKARKIHVRGTGRVFYDFNDLFVIERELFHRHPVPATWQERAEIRDRCPLPVERLPAAA